MVAETRRSNFVNQIFLQLLADELVFVHQMYWRYTILSLLFSPKDISLQRLATYVGMNMPFLEEYI
jgi:hypothetical protein